MRLPLKMGGFLEDLRVKINCSGMGGFTGAYVLCKGSCSGFHLSLKANITFHREQIALVRLCVIRRYVSSSLLPANKELKIERSLQQCSCVIHTAPLKRYSLGL